MAASKNEKRRFVGNEAAWRFAMIVAFVSGLFALTVSVSLIANYLQIRAVDPLNNPELLRLREQLAAAPGEDEKLVEQIRALDLLSRKAFFTSQAHLRTGGQLLLGGVVVSLVALRLAARWNPKRPAPGEAADPRQYWHTITRAKELIAVAAVCLVVVSLAAAYLTPTDIPLASSPPAATQEESSQPAEVPAAYPTWEAIQKQWPAFRGPGGYGVAYYTTAPTEWDGAAGDGIRWKTEVPLPGKNSPVVWGNRLFLSSATEDVREVYCYDTDTGELVWQKGLAPFPGTPEEPPDVIKETGYAAPTMAVHGDRAFAIFANGDLACFGFEGDLLWGCNIGVPDNHYGHSSSLIAYEDLVFVQFDDSAEPRLIALDVASGEEAWVTPREKISWASPACVPTPFGVPVILASEQKVDAYDPRTGALVWS